MAKVLRILSIRIDDRGNSVNWTEMREVIVRKKSLDQIFFKTTLKQRMQPDPNNLLLHKLYTEPPKISKEKYEDLMSLCNSALPVVRGSEHVNFFKSLPQ